MAEVLQLGDPSETVRRQALLRQLVEAAVEIADIPDDELIDLAFKQETAYSILYRANWMLYRQLDKMATLGQVNREELVPKKKWRFW